MTDMNLTWIMEYLPGHIYIWGTYLVSSTVLAVFFVFFGGEGFFSTFSSSFSLATSFLSPPPPLPFLFLLPPLSFFLPFCSGVLTVQFFFPSLLTITITCKIEYDIYTIYITHTQLLTSSPQTLYTRYDIHTYILQDA